MDNKQMILFYNRKFHIKFYWFKTTWEFNDGEGQYKGWLGINTVNSNKC